MDDTLINKTLDTIRRHGMLPEGAPVLVAVSGGPDSMALMHAMYELRDTLGVEIAVAHFDHGLRPESASEAEFVRDAAGALGLRFFTERAELSGVPGNVQTVAREARYGFLERAAARLDRPRIATAHTMDDQAETYLMRDIRGSGSSGLKGIPPVRGMFIRPFIDVRRPEIITYLESRGIEYLSDPTNLKPVYLRNRVRMEIMPIITDINPGAVETLAREADIARIEDEYLGMAAEEAFGESVTETSEGSVTLDAGRLRSMHPAIRRRVIREAVRRLKGDLLGVTYGHVMDVDGLVSDGVTGRGIDLPGGVRFETSYDKAFFTLHDEPAPYEYALAVPGTAHIPEAGITVVAETAPGTSGADGRSSILIDADKLKGPLCVRSRRPGDRFHPAGMDGTKKLKDYLIDRKVSRRERDILPLLVTGNDIVWVMGHRQDARFAAAEGSKRVIRVFFEPEHG